MTKKKGPRHFAMVTLSFPPDFLAPHRDQCNFRIDHGWDNFGKEKGIPFLARQPNVKGEEKERKDGWKNVCFSFPFIISLFRSFFWKSVEKLRRSFFRPGNGCEFSFPNKSPGFVCVVFFKCCLWFRRLNLNIIVLVHEMEIIFERFSENR